VNKNSYDIPNRAINLPSYNEMTDENQNAILECIQKVI
jgi:dTDP-4-amino-4,6-dideoxygalactose transaminase